MYMNQHNSKQLKWSCFPLAILAQGRGTPEQVGEETATYSHLATYEASAEHYVQVSLAPYQQELK